MDASLSTPPTAPRAPRRWPRRILAVAGLLVLAVVLAPTWADGLVRGLIVRRLSSTLDARVSLRGLDLAWPARMRLTGLEVSESDGAPLASLQEAAASLSLGALFRGRLEGTLSALYPEIHLRREPDGSWNWERVATRLEDLGGEESSSSEETAEAPDVRLELTLEEGRVVLHGRGGDSRVEGLAVHLRVDDLAQPAPFEITWRLRGPGGPGGGGRLSGSIVAAPEGRLDPREATGTARAELEGLDLAALAPALADLVPASAAEGKASGALALELGEGLALQGRVDLEVHDVRVQGPLAEAPPTAIASLTVEGRADMAADGSGAQHLVVRADGVLGLNYDGTTRVDDAGRASLEGTLAVTGDLAGLVEAARSWIPFQPGVQTGGLLEERVHIAAELDARRPLRVRVEAHGGLQGLSARDARGRTLDLSALASPTFDVEVEADLEAETVALKALHLALGPVDVRADARLGALLSRPRLEAGHASVVADLENLRGALAQVVALPADAFGGHLEASGDLTGDADALDFRARLSARDLAGGGLALASAQGGLEGRWSPASESRAAGELVLGALRLARADGAPLDWPGVRLGASATRAPDGRLSIEAQLEGAEGALVASVAGAGQLSTDLAGELVLRPTWRASIDVLAERARALAPELADLTGRLEGQGELHLARTAEGARLAGTVTTRVTGLGSREPGGPVVSVPGATEASTELRLALVLPEGQLEIEEATLRCEAVRASATARVTELLAGSPRLARASVAVESDLDALGSALAAVVDLGQGRLSGGALRAEGEVVSQGTAFEVKGHGTVALARWQAPEAAPPVSIEQSDVHAGFDLEIDPGTGSLVVRTLRMGSATLDAELRGRLDHLADPDAAQGELHLSVDGELERLLADFGLEAPGRKTTGRLHSRHSLAGTRGEFRLEGASTVEGFRLEVPAAAPEDTPLVIAEPRIELGLAADLTLPAVDVVVERVSIASSLARGGAGGRLPGLRAWLLGEEGAELALEGWTGELAYVPERLGAVLAPWLPGRLTGSEERRATLVFEGRARDLDLATLLGGSRGHVDLAMGKLVRPEIEMEGDLGLDLGGGRTKVRGDLVANGGALSLDGDLALEGAAASDASSRLALEVHDVGLNAGLAPLLAYAHPAFGSLDLARGQLGGLASLSLNLDYDRPIPAAALGGDWSAMPLAPLHGAGRLEIRGATLRGSPLLKALGELGLDVEREFSVRPIEFTIERGRLTYARPWAWTIGGSETTFTGSVGLDRSVDLTWNVPVTEGLVKRWGFLEPLLGERIAVPIGGTVTRPRVDVGATLQDLGKDLARKELGGALGLGDGSDPARLLADADRLWREGKKTEAAPLYRRLRDEFKLSLVYLVNKDRIKERAREPR